MHTCRCVRLKMRMMHHVPMMNDVACMTSGAFSWCSFTSHRSYDHTFRLPPSYSHRTKHYERLGTLPTFFDSLLSFRNRSDYFWPYQESTEAFCLKRVEGPWQANKPLFPCFTYPREGFTPPPTPPHRPLSASSSQVETGAAPPGEGSGPCLCYENIINPSKFVISCDLLSSITTFCQNSTRVNQRL